MRNIVAWALAVSILLLSGCGEKAASKKANAISGQMEDRLKIKD